MKNFKQLLNSKNTSRLKMNHFSVYFGCFVFYHFLFHFKLCHCYIYLHFDFFRTPVAVGIAMGVARSQNPALSSDLPLGIWTNGYIRIRLSKLISRIRRHREIGKNSILHSILCCKKNISLYIYLFMY